MLAGGSDQQVTPRAEFHRQHQLQHWTDLVHGTAAGAPAERPEDGRRRVLRTPHKGAYVKHSRFLLY